MASNPSNIQETEDTNISKHQQTRQLRRYILVHWITIVNHSSGFQDHTMGAISHLHTHHSPVLQNRQNLEHWVGFEPTALRICNPLHWATLPPVHKLL